MSDYEMEQLVGKFIRDNKTGDIGKIIELKGTHWHKIKYFLIKWVHITEGSWHDEETSGKKGMKETYYAQYRPERIIEPNGRFEILSGSEAFVYVI